MISQNDVEKALMTLESAEDAAFAKAARIKAEHMLKVTKSLIMAKNKKLPVNAQERDALISPEYAEQIEVLRQAVFNDELQKSHREAAQATIDAWRTQEASNRITI
tara:strand:- start:330 stop:647 length:318 start_codon:yes stop_codon:yes gene_type:complete